MGGLIVICWMAAVAYFLFKIERKLCAADKYKANKISKSDIDFIRSLQNEKNDSPDIDVS